MKEATKKSVRDNFALPLAVQIIILILTALLPCIGLKCYYNVRFHDYVEFDDITELIESYFVNTGFVEGAVLEEKEPSEQLAVISDAMSEQEKSIFDLQTQIEGLNNDKADLQARKRSNMGTIP